MITNEMLKSVWSSISLNGTWHTFRLLLHFRRFKKNDQDIYQLDFAKVRRALFLRTATSDFSVFRQVFMNDEYGFAISTVPKVIVDAGANVGFASVYFKNRFPKSLVYAIEPDAGNFEMLRRNLNGYEGTTLVRGALWNMDTSLTLDDQGVDKWGIKVKATNGKGSVEGFSLATFMQRNNLDRIDLLKIDIEGAEWEVFNSNYESWLPKVKVLVIELHEALRPGCTEIFQKAIGTIRHTTTTKGENTIVYNLD